MNREEEKSYFTSKCLDNIRSRRKDLPAPEFLDESSSLDDCALFFDTDKSSRIHNVCVSYERFLRSFRSLAFNLFEFGILHYSSLNMWASYFPNATIIGIDPFASTSQGKKERDNILVYEMDAYDYAAMKNLFHKHEPLVIVDDATHYWNHQINAFEEYFPLLQAGGIYVVEDIETSYGEFRKGIWANQKDDPASFFLNIANLLAGHASEGVHPLAKPAPMKLIDNIEGLTFINNAIIALKK